MLTFEDLNIKTRVGQSRYYTQCPECSKDRKKSNTPCLTINDEPGNRWYKCWHCGWSGNLDVQDKYEKVQENSKMPKNVQAQFSIEVRNYLNSRGISSTTAKKLGLYEAQHYKTTLICFPFYMNKTLVNVKFLNYKWTKESKGIKWFQMKKDYGTRIIPFGMQLINFKNLGRKKVLIITEGEWDAATWHECGFNNAISVPQGAPEPNAKNFEKEFAYMHDKYVQSVFKEVDMFYLSIDNDKAGKNLTNHLAMILGKDKCRIIQYPSEYKDINEVLAGNKDKGLKPLGRKGVEECYENVRSFPIAGIIKSTHVEDDLIKIREDGFVPGLGVGIKELDSLFTVKKKLIMFVTGVPGSGKSVFIRWWVVKLIQHNVDLDIKFAMFTPENRPVAREIARIAEVLTGKSIKKSYKNSMSDELFIKAKRWIDRHFHIISPNRKNFESFNDKVDKSKVNTLDSILRYVEYLKKTENIFGYVIDAWNKIEHEQPKYETETNFISKQLDRLLNFNDYYDLFGIVIAHPKKIDEHGRNYKMPSLYDIKGSSSWKEKADIGLVIHRYKYKKVPEEDLPPNPDEDDKYMLIQDAPNVVTTEKIKFEELGYEGKIKMKMNVWQGGNFYVLDKNGNPLRKEEAARTPEEADKIKQDEAVQAVLYEDLPEADEDTDLPF